MDPDRPDDTGQDWDPEIDPDWDQAVEMPIDGELDLHTFRPGEVKELLRDYLEACQDKGILEVRVIHGKGKGVLRRTVHASLERMPLVESFALGDVPAGGWGATMVWLKPGKG